MTAAMTASATAMATSVLSGSGVVDSSGTRPPPAAGGCAWSSGGRWSDRSQSMIGLIQEEDERDDVAGELGQRREDGREGPGRRFGEASERRSQQECRGWQ